MRNMQTSGISPNFNAANLSEFLQHLGISRPFCWSSFFCFGLLWSPPPFFIVKLHVDVSTRKNSVYLLRSVAVPSKTGLWKIWRTNSWVAGGVRERFSSRKRPQPSKKERRCYDIYCERCESKDRRIIELEMRNNELVLPALRQRILSNRCRQRLFIFNFFIFFHTLI